MRARIIQQVRVAEMPKKRTTKQLQEKGYVTPAEAAKALRELADLYETKTGLIKLSIQVWSDTPSDAEEAA